MKNANDPTGNRTREMAISSLCENLLRIFHYLPCKLYILFYCTWKLFYCYPMLSDFSSSGKQNAVLNSLSLD